MNTPSKEAFQPSRDQIIYANLLVIGVWISIFTLIITYVVYISGILPSHVDMSLIPKVWNKGVNEYLELTHSPHGWGWTALILKGDFLNYIGFVLLGMMTVLCFTVLLRGYIRRKNRIFSIIAFLEIVVLCLAASGILGSGGH